MLVTLVAVLCNSQLCLEKVVTTSDQSGITMTACAVNAQIGIADWLAKGPYREWRLALQVCAWKIRSEERSLKSRRLLHAGDSLPGIANLLASEFVNMTSPSRGALRPRLAGISSL